MKKIICSLTVCLLSAFVSYAATYYVSPTGNDANNGLSRGAAFGAFLTATEALADNDTLVFCEGIYTNPVNRTGQTEPNLILGQKTNGTFLSGVTFKGDGPDKTIFLALDGGPAPNIVNDARLIRLFGTNNKIESFAVKGDLNGNSWWYPVVYIMNAMNVVISNIYVKFPITQTDRTGIAPVWNDSVTNLLVTHCLVDGGGVGLKDFNNGRKHKSTFRNCTLVNQVDNNNNDRGIGVIIEGNDGMIVKNCIMMNQTKHAMSFWAPDVGVATSKVENCIWYNAPDFADIRANTVVDETGTQNVDPGLQTDPSGLPYCSPLSYAAYGWRVVPEPAIGLLLGLLAFAGLRRS